MDLIVRVQSGEHGNCRCSIKTTDSLSVLYEKVKAAFKLPEASWILCTDRKNPRGTQLKPSSQSISKHNVRNGDLLFLCNNIQPPKDNISNGSINSSPSVLTPSKQGLASTDSVREDEVDVLLDNSEGKIHRQRNEQMCRHGPTGKCVHCIPLEPFDEDYLRQCDPPIKFLSFHSYLRKLRSGVDKGKFVNLENLSCKIKADCREHAPWPAGICTKCQPNAITLNRQKFRHIDYVTFENGNIMDRFLNYWRSSGHQRMGFLIGQYEPHPDIPLGIRAVVSAIYEPPQSSTKNSIELLTDENEAAVDELIAELGMRRVGWIFTDLVAKDLTEGTVKQTRGTVDSYFLSAEECIMAADFQNRYPNVCRWSSEGIFGSKFVTVVVTGDKDHQIHFEGYQVSDQCMGLVRDNCLIPTYDAPELGYIKESTNEQYVPDVFYKDKDKYGNDITYLARPLPVEYLLTEMSVAFPKEPLYSFCVSAGKSPYTVANRSDIGEIQDLSTLAVYMQQFADSDFLASVADLHVLLFLSICEVMPLRTCMGPLLAAVKTKDSSAAMLWSHCEQWSTMQHLLQASLPSPTAGSSSRQASYVGASAAPLPPIGRSWQCSHCTFINTGSNHCEMCSLPKA